MWEFRIAKMYTVQGEICNTDNKALKQVLHVQILNSGESRLPPQLEAHVGCQVEDAEPSRAWDERYIIY